MADRPTPVELLRYLDGDLPTRRAREIERLVARDSDIAADAAEVEANLRLQAQLREVMAQSIPGEIDQRIEVELSKTVVSTTTRRDEE